MKIKDWNTIKQTGNSAFKTGGVEPIDLYKTGGILHDGIIWNIIKCAYRSRRELNISMDEMMHNMGEIKHYADMLLSAYAEKHGTKVAKPGEIIETDYPRVFAI